MEAQHRPESQGDTGMAVICEGQWHTRTSHSLGRERQARGGETEIDAEPREAGGRQACQRPAYHTSRERGLDPKGYGYRTERTCFPHRGWQQGPRNL